MPTAIEIGVALHVFFVLTMVSHAAPEFSFFVCIPYVLITQLGFDARQLALLDVAAAVGDSVRVVVKVSSLIRK